MERARSVFPFYYLVNYYVVYVFLFSSFVGFKLIFEHCSFLMSVRQMEIVALGSTVFPVHWGFQALGVLDQL